MSKRRNWLDRISGWILDALPSEKSQDQKTSKEDKRKPEKAKEGNKTQYKNKPSQGQSSPAVPRGQLTEKAWARFEEEWTRLGFERDLFVSRDEIADLIQELEKEFKDDLTEALYQLSINSDALRSLRDILDRGKVSIGDNLTAIRCYAYIGILASNTKPAPSKRVESDTATKKEDGQEISESTLSTHVKHERDSQDQAESGNSSKEDLLQKDLRTLRIQIKTLNALLRCGFNNIRDISRLDREDFLSLKNFGIKSLEDLEEALAVEGLDIPIEKKAASAASQYTAEDPKEPGKNDSQYAESKESNYGSWRKRCINALKQEADMTYKQAFDKTLELLTTTSDPDIESALLRVDGVLSVLASGVEELNKEKHALVDAVKLEVLRSLIKDNENEIELRSRVQKISRLTNSSAKRSFNFLIDRAAGKKMTELGKMQAPPISRERVRQSINNICGAIGIDIQEWIGRGKKIGQERLALTRKSEVRAWIETLKRPPIDKDSQESYQATPLAKDAIGMNLKERLDLIVETGHEVTPSEHDYHYQYILLGKGVVGNGYWQDFSNLREFLIRHAAALGEPSLMPKQTSLPRAVGGVVGRYGGQMKVAERVGLTYQGQLVGEGGRAFWTEENLKELLEQTCEMKGIEKELMPATGDIFEYLQTTENKKYQNKKPPSAIAALTKQGKLHWSEVAARFNKRFVIGESQKAITLSFIKAFVRDLGEHLDSLSPSELYVLFQSQGISRKDNERFSRTFDVLVDAIQSGVVSKDELSDWAKNNEVDSVSELLELGSEIKETSSIEEKEDKYLEARSKKIREESDGQTEITLVSKEDLPSLDPESTLKALDKATEVVESTSTDEDKVHFLKAKATAKLWDACFRDEEGIINKVEHIKPPLDAYSAEIKEGFLKEYRGSKALPIPDTYQFRDLRGNRRDPKLMQRLVAYRLKRDGQLLNLSGTGTGKTLSAIYSAQICGAKRILISCPNGVLSSWERAFNTAYPEAVIHIKLDGWQIPAIDSRTHVYMVNHERFQELYAERMLAHCVGFAPDLVVIDEIHQSKRRTKDKTSQRRKLMNEYLRIAKNITPQLKILGMSATPVINNLYEGRSLLELVNQETIQDVDEKIDLNSCMNLYQHFVRSGIRMNPGSLSRTEIIIEDINATELLPKVIAATKSGTYHDVEQILVPAKIGSLHKCIERGKKTVIFITYIKSTLRPLASWLQQQGISHCVYTGNDKDATSEGFEDALDEFIRGSTEVLIASIKCVGTGVDGLQSVCDRAVFFQLPWTSTEFEQAIGRLDRDGTEFDSIKIYLPMTDIHLPNGERWSWCRSKFDRIQSKRDIAKAAVDGEVPDAASMISPSEAAKYWIGWLKRLEQE